MECYQDLVIVHKSINFFKRDNIVYGGLCIINVYKYPFLRRFKKSEKIETEYKPFFCIERDGMMYVTNDIDNYK